MLAALLFASAAEADTITLGSAPGFGALQEYLNVPNDAGAVIDIYQDSVTIDGVSYLDSSFQSITLLTSKQLRCVRSGRGQSCHYIYLLVSGTIVR
jgi:hypothetical protein